MKKVVFLSLIVCLLIHSVAAQEVTITDPKFLNALIEEGIDTNGDSIITTGEAEAIRFLNISHREITDIKGIEAFVNLDTLYCHYNGIQSIDLAALTGLKNLNCGSNNLASLDLSATVQLLELDCQSNQLESLDVSMCSDLHSLFCFLNHLDSLDVSGSASLRVLECYNNGLTELDVSSNHLLENLACVSNQLTILDVTGNPEIRYLNCADNHLTSLDLTGNNSLLFLHCEQNLLEYLDVSNCSSLVGLECQGNQLDTLDLSANTSLTYLDCSENRVSNLDVALNVALLFLGCRDNLLEALNVTENIALKTIDCSNNLLTRLDISQNILLTELRCQDNRLVCLDLSGSTMIERLDCSGNLLVSVDLRHFKGCDWFNCVSLRNMPTLLQVCLSDMSYSFLISLTGSPNAYFTTECLDIEAPTLFAEDSVINTDMIQVVCNENAFLYLVPEGTERDLQSIRGVALDSIEIVARTETVMPLGGIGNGIYWLYAADTSGNISEPWPFTVLRVGEVLYTLDGISVYPVPFEKMLTVRVEAERPVTIRIIAPNGTIVHTGNYRSSPVNIDLGSLARGIYILNLELAGKQHYFRIIKL